MTSTVDTSVKYFTSDMPGAPVLTGEPGKRLALLRACLVDGFGAGSIPIQGLSVSSGVAWWSYPPTTYGNYLRVRTGSVVQIQDVTNKPGLNGEQKVIAFDDTGFAFATTEADGTATGSITASVAPLGWSMPFSGTHKAAFRSTHPQSTGMYLRIDDSTGQYARVVGYEQMSGIDTGTGPFPNESQMAGGGYWSTNFYNDTTPIKWTLVGDSRGFFLNTEPQHGITHNSGHYGGMTRWFGDFESFKLSGDSYACALGYSPYENASYAHGAIDGGDNNTAFSRPASGVGSPVMSRFNPLVGGYSYPSGVDPTMGNFPSNVDGGLILSKRYAADADGVTMRGLLPGVYSCPQYGLGAFFVPWSLIDGAGDLAGRKLLVLPAGQYSNAYPATSVGAMFVDVTGPWR